MKLKIEEVYQELKKTNVVSNVGLLTGLSGQIISLANYEKIIQIRSGCIVDFLEILEDKITNESFVYSYCSGLAGIGWLYEYLKSCEFINGDTNELLEDFDKPLEKALMIDMAKWNYDFLHGGVGIALYFVKRILKNQNLFSVLNHFLDCLDKIKEYEKENQFKWKSVIDITTKETGYNISMSHGSSSIVCLLAKMYQLDNNSLNKKLIKNLLNGAMEYIIDQEIDRERYKCYFASMSIESDKILQQSRMGWCYGDLGIATTLYQAGKALQNQNWIDKSLEILLYTAENRKSLEEGRVADAGLCHGTAGIGHIFYRAWWNTRMPEFKKASDYWFEQTLKMAKFEDGLAGFKTWYVEEGWINNYSLLQGITGIGLALLTYYHEVEPTWDECLLLS